MYLKLINDNDLFRRKTTEVLGAGITIGSTGNRLRRRLASMITRITRERLLKNGWTNEVFLEMETYLTFTSIVGEENETFSNTP